MKHLWYLYPKIVSDQKVEEIVKFGLSESFWDCTLKVNNDDNSDGIIDEFNNNKEAKNDDTFLSDDTTNQKYDSSDESEKKGTFMSATVSSAQSPRQKVIAAMRDPLFILGAMCILVIGLVGGNHERIATFFAGIRKQNISADSLSNHSTSPNCELIDHLGKKHLRVKKDIMAGEELTLTYDIYDPEK